MSEGADAATAGDVVLPGFVAASPASRHVARLAERASRRASSVLVTGESGVGKSQLARSMHDHARGGEPFVIIDCGNLPESLVENELFGHEAGAFSGATERRPGKFEAAGQGTALLDRVTDLSARVQGSLLRVLQERVFERVGGHESIEVRAQVIATAAEDLGERVRRGLFREDLYYRLHVVHLEIAPLRERPEDVPALAAELLGRLGRRLGRPLELGDDALDLLEGHRWPGNVRELANALERAATLSERSVLTREELAPTLEAPSARPERAVEQLADAGLSLEELERRYVGAVLRRHERFRDAAKVLGIHRKTLLEKRRRHGLP